MTTAVITRRSVGKAFQLGIKAEQLIRFMKARLLRWSLQAVCPVRSRRGAAATATATGARGAANEALWDAGV
jgi:hypothetical protein